VPSRGFSGMAISGSSSVNSGLPIWQTERTGFTAPVPQKIEAETVQDALDSAVLTSSIARMPKESVQETQRQLREKKEAPKADSKATPINPLAKAVAQCNSESMLPAKISMTSTGALMIEDESLPGMLPTSTPHPEAVQEQKGKAGNTSSPSPESIKNDGEKEPLDHDRKEELLRKLQHKIDELERRLNMRTFDRDLAKGELADIQQYVDEAQKKYENAADEDKENSKAELDQWNARKEEKENKIRQYDGEIRDLEAEIQKKKEQYKNLYENDVIPDERNDDERPDFNPWIESRNLMQREEELVHKRERLSRSMEGS
jgi:hypothetical protein